MNRFAAAGAFVLACAATAHGQDAGIGGAVDLIVPPRVEVGVSGGASATSPEIGALLSLPLGDRVSFDVGASYLARLSFSPAFALGQAQVRVPFRPRLRSRYSLVAGVIYLEAIDRQPGDSPLWLEGLHPQVGASMQWPLGHAIDLRVDTQLVVQFDEVIPVAPRAVAAFVWHTGAARAARLTGGTP